MSVADSRTHSIAVPFTILSSVPGRFGPDIRAVRATAISTKALSSAATNTPARSALAPMATAGGELRSMPSASAGTLIVQATNATACSAGSRADSGGDGMTRPSLRANDQYHANIGMSSACTATTICAKNPTRPRTPYAAAA